MQCYCVILNLICEMQDSRQLKTNIYFRDFFTHVGKIVGQLVVRIVVVVALAFADVAFVVVVVAAVPFVGHVQICFYAAYAQIGFS